MTVVPAPSGDGLGQPPAQTAPAPMRRFGRTELVPTMRIDYACMQASGMVMNHTQDCDRYADLANAG